MTTEYFGPPTPAYNNPPIQPQNYKPSRFVISAISTGPTTTITTSVNHNYVIGQLVRLLLQPTYGASQLNGKTGYVIAIPQSNQITTDLNSQVCDPFIPSPAYGPTLPQVLAIGDNNTGIISTTGRYVIPTTIPGSFANISPQ